jgi:hypothetical protein
LASSPLDQHTLVSYRGKTLLLYSSYLPLGVPNWTVLYIINTVLHQPLFWRHCRGGKRRLLQGEFCTHILYFVLTFALLYFYLHHFIKNTKKN